MNSYKVLFSNKHLVSNDVIIEEVESKREINNELESSCRGEWRKIIAEAKEQGRKIWESRIYRFESCRWSGNQVFFNFSTIPFSIRFSLNQFTNRIRDLGFEYAALGLFSSCFVETADNKFVFIKKSRKYYTLRQYSFIGGVLSKDERELKNGQDLFREVQKEISEEIGCEIDIKNIFLEAGYITENFNFCLIFYAKTDLFFSNLSKLFKNGDGETARVIGIEHHKLVEFSRKYLLPKDYVKFDMVELR